MHERTKIPITMLIATKLIVLWPLKNVGDTRCFGAYSKSLYSSDFSIRTYGFVNSPTAS